MEDSDGRAAIQRQVERRLFIAAIGVPMDVRDIVVYCIIGLFLSGALAYFIWDKVTDAKEKSEKDKDK